MKFDNQYDSSTSTKVKKWLDKLPKKCDICGNNINKIFIDGKTKFSPWGIMCRKCHKEVGIGLGLGKGQMYDIESKIKIKG